MVALAAALAAGVLSSPPWGAAQPSKPAGAAAARRGGAPQRLDPPAARGGMAPNLAADGRDLLLTWLEPAAGAGKGAAADVLRFARLSGDRWSPPVTVAAAADLVANWADFPAVAAGPQGLLAHWLGTIGDGRYAYGIHLVRSGDGGATWQPLGDLHDDGTPTEHGFVSYVPQGSGVRAFWLDGRALAGEAGQAQTTGEAGQGQVAGVAGQAQTAGAGHDHPAGEASKGAMALRTAVVPGAPAGSEVLDARVCDCCQTDAAMAAEGPLVVYRDRTADEVRDIAIVRRTAAGWSEPALVHADGWRIPGCPVNGPAVAAGGWRVAVAWFTAAASGTPPRAVPRVRIAFSDDGGARFGRPHEIDGGRPLGRVDLLLTTGGDAVVSWLGLDPPPGKGASVRLRRVTPRGAGAPLTVGATSASRASGFPRMALQGDRLVLAWVDEGEPSRVRAAAIPLAALPAAP